MQRTEYILLGCNPYFYSDKTDRASTIRTNLCRSVSTNGSIAGSRHKARTNVQAGGLAVFGPDFSVVDKLD
jgi:hypothetical protein